jgi:hypothetical protein
MARARNRIPLLHRVGRRCSLDAVACQGRNVVETLIVFKRFFAVDCTFFGRPDSGTKPDQAGLDQSSNLDPVRTPRFAANAGHFAYTRVVNRHRSTKRSPARGIAILCPVHFPCIRPLACGCLILTRMHPFAIEEDHDVRRCYLYA